MNDEALKLLKLGLSVIPLGTITRDANRKKVILYPLPWKKYQTAHATEDEVKKWRVPNLGVVTGKTSGILVLDCDEYKPTFDRELFRSFNIPVTPVQQTAGGGRQYFFKLPPNVNIRNSVSIGHAESGIDIRADGGMVIVAPSTTSYGEYLWLVDPFETPFADVPPKLLDMLLQHSTPTPKKKRNLKDFPGMIEGAGRNDAMASFVGKLLKVTPWNEWDQEVWPAAVALNASFKPPMDARELQTTYDSIVHKETERRITEQKKESPKDLSARKSFKELITQDFPDAQFAIEPFFEIGTVNMLSAPPNTWKSWMFFVMAANVAAGTEFLGKWKTVKTKVMIVNEEDTERLIAARFKALEIVDQNLDIYFRTAQQAKLDTGYVKSLIAECKKDGIGIVFFDSLRALHDADENSSTAMQPIMDHLKTIAQEGITVVFTHHNKKKGPFEKGDSAESFRGSSAINAAIFGHLSLEEVEKEDGKYIVVRHLKSKSVEKLQPFEIKVIAEEGKVRFEFTGDHDDTTKVAERTKDAVYEYMVKDRRWIGTKELKEANLGGDTYIRMALKGLVTTGLIEVIGKTELLLNDPTAHVSGPKNAKFYRAREVDRAEMEEDEKEADATWGLLTGE